MTRLLFALLLPALLFAQGERTLTVDEAVQLGLENSPMLRSTEARAVAAGARAGEANAARLPSLRLNTNYTRRSDVDPFAVQLPSSPSPVVIFPTVLNQYSSRLSVQHPLFTGFKLEKSAEAAGYLVQAADVEVEGDRVAVAYRVKAAYWNLYKANEVRRVVGENVRQMEAHLSDVRNMMAQGMVTENEVLKVEVQLSGAELAKIEAENGAKNACMALNSLLGLPLGTEVQLTSLPKQDRTSVPLTDHAIQQALITRPDAQAAEMRMNAAAASVAASRGGWWPQINLVGNLYYSRPNPYIMPTKDEFRETWDIGVSLSWDLWSWGTTRHQSDQAEALHSQTRYALTQVKDNVTLEIHQSYLALEQVQEEAQVAARGVVHAEENYRLTKAMFAAGTATNTDLLDAEVALLQARLNQTVSLADYELANAKLERAMGRQ